MGSWPGMARTLETQQDFAILPVRRAMFCPPPHCACNQPPGRSDVKQSIKQAIVIEHPVERCGADDAVEGAGKWEIHQIGGDHLGSRSPNCGCKYSRADRDMFCETSSAITRPRGSACSRSAVRRPVPAPASRTSSSPRNCRRARTFFPQLTCGCERRWYSEEFHSRLEFEAWVILLGWHLLTYVREELRAISVRDLRHVYIAA